MKRKGSFIEENTIKKLRQAVPWDSLPMEIWLMAREYLVSIIDRANLRVVSRAFNAIPRKSLERTRKSWEGNMSCYLVDVAGDKHWIFEKHADDRHPRCIMQLEENTLLDIAENARIAYPLSPRVKKMDIKCNGAVQYGNTCYYVCCNLRADSTHTWYDSPRTWEMPLLLGYDFVNRKVTSYYWSGCDYPDDPKYLIDCGQDGEKYDGHADAMVEATDRFLTVQRGCFVFWFDMASRRCRGQIYVGADGRPTGPVEYIIAREQFRTTTVGYAHMSEDESYYDDDYAHLANELPDEYDVPDVWSNRYGLERYFYWSDYDSETFSWSCREFNTM